MYQKLYQEVIEYFSYQDFVQEYEQARKSFEKKVGRVVSDHSFFETWIESFIEYFTFDAYLPTYGIPPISLYYKMNQERFSEEEKEHFQKLLMNKISIVQFQKEKGSVLECFDVFEKEPVQFIGGDKHHPWVLRKDDWMIVRSVPDENQNVIFGSAWHFPNEIGHILSKNIARFQNKLSFIHDCMAKKVFSENYKHVDLEKIFETHFQKEIMEVHNAQTK